jgi:Ser/Thr protein kinase RdoA (MazF antagonist)
VAKATALVDPHCADGTLSATERAVLRAARDRSDSELRELGAPLRAVHGDSHLGNVLATAGGPLRAFRLAPQLAWLWRHAT